MARILVTGAADGLGRMAATLMAADGHEVILHARSEARVAEARAQIPGAAGTVAGDLASIESTRQVAEQVNRLGTLDAVIHNAGMGFREKQRGETIDGLPPVFAVNSLAPYILTALIERPKRLIYISSGLHQSADAGLEDLTWTRRPWSGSRAYAESKLHDVILAFAIARRWPDVRANALEPGWVATKMGGAGAPDDLDQGARTQVWLATSEEPRALVTGGYFYHLKPRPGNSQASQQAIQERFLEECARLSGVALPD
jgi:NAD(P)-dependent dehydrogenase (short-subunit alcohol dehydrogenase family)